MPIQRGDIYFVNLNPVQGREQAGQRPVLVLSIDTINRLPLVVTVAAAFCTWRFVPESPVRVPGRVNWLAAALILPAMRNEPDLPPRPDHGSDDGWGHGPPRPPTQPSDAPRPSCGAPRSRHETSHRSFT